MADILKIGIKTIAPKEIQPEKQELKLYVGEKVSARVEKGGNGEAILTIKGLQINAKGNTEFKNGDIISLKIKGMEDGNILVETAKDEEVESVSRGIEEKNLKTVRVKEEIIREGIEQKTAMSGEKIEKILNSYRQIEAESERIKKERTEKNSEKMENTKENKDSSKTAALEVKSRQLEENKKEEVLIEKKEEKIAAEEEKKDGIKLKYENEKTVKKESSNEKEFSRQIEQKVETESYTENKTELKTELKTESNVAQNRELTKEEKKNAVPDSIKKESVQTVKEEAVNRGKGIEKENNINNSEQKKVEDEPEKKEIQQKTENSDTFNLKERSRLKEKNLNIIQNSNREYAKEAVEKYGKQEIKESIPEKNMIKEIGKFVAEKEMELKRNTGEESLKTLVKLENSQIGLNSEAFKLLHSFYKTEAKNEITIDENLKENIKNFIKTISEGESSEAKGTLLANAINRSHGDNTLEFILNIAQFKSPCEIKIAQQESSSENSQVKNTKYMTIKLELEKLGKVSVTVFLDDKRSTDIIFTVEDESKKKIFLDENDKLAAMFQAKGINIGNIRVVDKKIVEKSINSSLDFKI